MNLEPTEMELNICSLIFNSVKIFEFKDSKLETYMQSMFLTLALSGNVVNSFKKKRKYNDKLEVSEIVINGKVITSSMIKKNGESKH